MKLIAIIICLFVILSIVAYAEDTQVQESNSAAATNPTIDTSDNSYGYTDDYTSQDAITQFSDEHPNYEITSTEVIINPDGSVQNGPVKVDVQPDNSNILYTLDDEGVTVIATTMKGIENEYDIMDGELRTVQVDTSPEGTSYTSIQIAPLNGVPGKVVSGNDEFMFSSTADLRVDNSPPQKQLGDLKQGVTSAETYTDPDTGIKYVTVRGLDDKSTVRITSTETDSDLLIEGKNILAQGPPDESLEVTNGDVAVDGSSGAAIPCGDNPDASTPVAAVVADITGHASDTGSTAQPTQAPSWYDDPGEGGTGLIWLGCHAVVGVFQLAAFSAKGWYLIGQTAVEFFTPTKSAEASPAPTKEQSQGTIAKQVTSIEQDPASTAGQFIVYRKMTDNQLQEILNSNPAPQTKLLVQKELNVRNGGSRLGTYE